MYIIVYINIVHLNYTLVGQTKNVPKSALFFAFPDRLGFFAAPRNVHSARTKLEVGGRVVICSVEPPRKTYPDTQCMVYLPTFAVHLVNLYGK